MSNCHIYNIFSLYGTTQFAIYTEKIVTFFGALKGKKPEMVYPQLPESTLKTPKPDFK